jgi:small subunit ribosomal protein S16
MAVILRLTRKGSKHRPFYHIVAIDSRKKRSGMFLEQIGVYDPLGETFLAVDEEAASRWIKLGAQTSDTVKKLLKRARVSGAASKPAASA